VSDYRTTIGGTTSPPTPRNAPNAHAALSGCVDALQYAVDEARAAGLHGIAAELDTHRDAVAGFALRLWGQRGAEQ